MRAAPALTGSLRKIPRAAEGASVAGAVRERHAWPLRHHLPQGCDNLTPVTDTPKKRGKACAPTAVMSRCAVLKVSHTTPFNTYPRRLVDVRGIQSLNTAPTDAVHDFL